MKEFPIFLFIVRFRSIKIDDRQDSLNLHYKITLQSAVLCLIFSPYIASGIANAIIATKIPAIVPNELT